ncbi:HrgA protein [Chromatiales bacterium (ex Bugula neritina AB1)]|nr:HrgA protein [Chromatiales bacterium (ex Bugula neritina AB1)]
MAFNLAQTVLSYLRDYPNQKFTAREIATWICKAYPDLCQEKKHNSQALNTDADLLQQLVAEIGSQRPRLQKKHPELKTTEGRPRKYYYSEQSDDAAVVEAESAVVAHVAEVNGAKFSENGMYPLLSQYLHEELGVYSKRIDEKRSSNKRGPNGNRWLYPDLVGMEDLAADWHPEVQSCIAQHSDKRTKLWSFEAKLLINRSNVRECFFQAASNSSWANFGYLVAAEIEGQDTLKELRMLYAAHGIGVIKLDTENPADSQVLIPARERDAIDWNIANRLATENRDFLEYVKLIKQFYQTGDACPVDWDLPELLD